MPPGEPEAASKMKVPMMQLSTSDASALRIAIAEFIFEMDPSLPPYWYSIDGDDMKSLAHLFRLRGVEFSGLLTMAAIYVARSDGQLRFHKDVFESAINLFPPRRNGIQIQKCKIGDSKTGQRREEWFIRIGSSTARRNWTAYSSAAKQLRSNQLPPRASVQLQLSLFNDCDVVIDGLEKLTSTEDDVDKRQPGEDIDETQPEGRHVASSPAATTAARDNADGASRTPVLDSYDPERHKGDPAKLKEILRELTAVLTTRNARTVGIESTNGNEGLIALVPKSTTLKNFLDLASRSKWINDVLCQAMPTLSQVWIDTLDISVTPKAHLLLDGHAAEQHERLRGLGDKTEDFVEKGHQIGMRDDRRTWNMANWEQQQRSQIRHSRRGSNRQVQRRIDEVHAAKRRNLKRRKDGGESLGDERKRLKKEETVVKRETVFEECRGEYKK